MDVGLFTTARNTPPNIPLTTTLVTTSGHGSLGVGPGTYVHDANFDTGGNDSTFSKLCFYDATVPTPRLFRLVENPINILQAGAVPGGTTDNLAAIQQVRDYLAKLNVSGGTIFVPAGRFRVSAKLVFPQQIRIIGEGNTQNPGYVTGPGAQGFPDLYNGSVLYFDAGVGGLDFLPFTDEEDMLTVKNDVVAHPNDSSFYEFQQAYRSVVRDLFILSASNSVGTFIDDANGIQARTTVFIENVWVQGFRGHGIRLEGTQDGSGEDGAMYGAVNGSSLVNIRSVKHVGSGFHIDGRDANVISLIGCDGSNNNLWGFNDETLLGNCYVNCHATNNNRAASPANTDVGTGGAFRCISNAAASTYFGCYVEDSGTPNSICKLTQSCIVLGGIMSGQQFFGTAEKALVLSAYGGLRGTLSGVNDIGAETDNDPPTVRAGLGRDPTRTQGTALWFGSSDDTEAMDAYRLKYSGVAAKTWNLEYANAGTGASPIQLPIGGSNWRTSTIYAPSFPQGIILGANGAGPRIHYGTAAPTSGDWQRGDMVINSNAASGQPSYWQCTASTGPGSPGTPAVFKAGPNLP